MGGAIAPPPRPGYATAEGPLHALRYLPNISNSLWYFVIHIRCSYAVFRYSYALFKVLFSNRRTHFCALTKNETNAITFSIRKRKIH